MKDLGVVQAQDHGLSGVQNLVVDRRDIKAERCGGPGEGEGDDAVAADGVADAVPGGQVRNGGVDGVGDIGVVAAFGGGAADGHVDAGAVAGVHRLAERDSKGISAGSLLADRVLGVADGEGHALVDVYNIDTFR